MADDDLFPDLVLLDARGFVVPKYVRRQRRGPPRGDTYEMINPNWSRLRAVKIRKMLASDQVCGLCSFTDLVYA